MRVVRAISLLFLSSICLSACFDQGTSYQTQVDAAATDATDGGSSGDVAVDTGVDASPDVRPCGGACAAPTPYCDETSGECVACTDDGQCAQGVCADDHTCVECAGDGDCTDGVCDTDANACVECLVDADCSGGVCDTDANTCVECLSDGDCTDGVCADDNTCVECKTNADCTDPSASLCDTATNTCTACTTNDDCSHLSGTTLCDTSAASGVCVACTVDDESACAGNSCDPATNTCTQTPVHSVGTCEPCKADSECVQDHRCIPMKFQGTDLPDGYCLKIASTGCNQPYYSAINRMSLSGAAAEDYCGIAESLTTCAAVLDLKASKTCSSDGECGLSGTDDARCEQVGLASNRCTYSCDLSTQCPGSTSCGSAPGNTDYCGGGS